MIRYGSTRPRRTSASAAACAVALGLHIALFLLPRVRTRSLLTAVDASATFELVAEETTQDRNNHTAAFQRQYVELLANQASGTLDNTDIRDHTVTFTELANHPGDSQESVFRLRRVVGNFSCSIDIDQTTDLQATYTNTIRPHLVALFQSTFSPAVYAAEDERISYDETTKRLSAAVQFLYQKAGGDQVVEVTQSVTTREARTIDYTPVHGGSEFGAYADPGFGIKERITNRTSIVVGSETPKARLTERAQEGEAGLLTGIAGEGGPDGPGLGGVSRTGWNTISSSSQVTPQWVGDPTTDEQIELSILTELVVERWNEAPSA